MATQLQADRQVATVRPSGAGLGADVVGADLTRLDDDLFATIHRALLDHLVIRFRGGDHIDDAQFYQLAKCFGPLKQPPGFTRTRKVHFAQFPEMTIISNIQEDGQTIGETGDGELNWHTDMGFTDVPCALSMLFAREVPATGGNTSFANMDTAYERLPEATKALIADLKCKHQASHNAQGGRRPGYQDIETDDVREMPGPQHPLVRTHPDSRRQALYLGRRFGAYVPGLPLAKSEALLDQLWAAVDAPGLTWTQAWQVGDLVIWDNRCTMHRRDSFAGQGRRRMHRLMTQGERPA